MPVEPNVLKTCKKDSLDREFAPVQLMGTIRPEKSREGAPLPGCKAKPMPVRARPADIGGQCCQPIMPCQACPKCPDCAVCGAGFTQSYPASTVVHAPEGDVIPGAIPQAIPSVGDDVSSAQAVPAMAEELDESEEEEEEEEDTYSAFVSSDEDED